MSSAPTPNEILTVCTWLTTDVVPTVKLKEILAAQYEKYAEDFVSTSEWDESRIMVIGDFKKRSILDCNRRWTLSSISYSQTVQWDLNMPGTDFRRMREVVSQVLGHFGMHELPQGSIAQGHYRLVTSDAKPLSSASQREHLMQFIFNKADVDMIQNEATQLLHSPYVTGDKNKTSIHQEWLLQQVSR